MKPDNSRPTTPIIPARDDTSSHVPERREHREAAADIARSQAEQALTHHDPVGDNGTISAHEAAEQHSHTTSQPSTASHEMAVETSPYRQTLSETAPETTADSNNEWQKYHSTWQRYYQEYYSRFYVGELYKSQTELMKRAEERAEAAAPTSEGISKDEAMNDLRSQLRDKITNTGKKIRHSRHFIPIAAAVVVMAVFVFLQYNTLIVATVKAYSSPGSINPSNVLVNPSESITIPVDQDNRLIIPKLNIDVPVNFNATPDNKSQMAAMSDGVAYFGVNGANAKPGQVGNYAISGHSSNQWYDTGNYKFIFVNLDELRKGDSIYVNFNQTRYTYTVTGKKVVEPTDVNSLRTNADTPQMTLITCTPAGTALHRLLVSTEQISPDPSTATANDTTTGDGKGKAAMPGNSPTVFEKLFSGN